MLSYAESISSRASATSTIRQTLEGAYSRPELSIKLKGEGKRSFTTGDTIEGEVTFTTHVETRFDDITITFEGISRTWMDKFGASPAAGARESSTTHTVSGRHHSGNNKTPFLITEKFLRLVQPIEEGAYPIPRVASGTLTFPFTFVVPQHLLPTSCIAKDENIAVKAAHMQVPPSFGDGPRDECTDDMAPDMARISYIIRVQVHRRRERDNAKVFLVNATHSIHMRPIVEEAPPVHIHSSGDYILRKEKDLRKGFLGKKMGRLVVSASEPKAMHLNSTSSLCPATTTVPVELTFTPSEPLMIPPTLGTVTTKLRTSTFFSTRHMSYFPTSSRITLDPDVGHYYETSLLSARCISNTRWEPATDPSTGKLIYKVHLNLPIAEPKGKTLVPSFSSCFITRTYRLDMSVSVQTSSHTQPSLSLKIPLQVAMPSKVGQEEQAALTYGVDEFFTPRSVAPPSPSSETNQVRQEIRRLQPRVPGYSIFGGQVSTIPFRIPEPMGISPGCG